MTPEAERLKELIKRLETLAEADRELDLELGALWPEPRPFNLSLVAMRNMKPSCPAFTASLDAAIALCERVLPGCEMSLSNLYGIPVAELPLNMDSAHAIARLPHGTLPLAVCLALLRAISQEPTT